MSTLSKDTIAKVNLGLLITTTVAMCTLAWHASAISTKVETLWADYLNRHSVAFNQPAKGNQP